MGAQIGQPAPDHARPPRRRDADLRDRAGLGVAQRPDALGARPATGRRTSSPRPSRCSPPTGCSWRIGGVWWFTWTDEGGGCQFCRSAGLLTEKRKAKPAWYRFNAWTGGDPDTVPRALFGPAGEELEVSEAPGVVGEEAAAAPTDRRR